MAIKLPSFKFFSASDAKSRILLLILMVVALGFAVFFIARYFSGSETGNASSVAVPPSGLESVPGGQLSAEYYRALAQANQQAFQQAQMSGGSAVPTLVNVPNAAPSGFQSQQNCTVLCPNADQVDVAKDIDTLLKSGKLTQKDADMLTALVSANACIGEYGDALDSLVKSEKLTPAQARDLLGKYKKQRQNALLDKSMVQMDGMIKTGLLSLDTANQLVVLQKSGITPSSFAGELNRLIKNGKLTSSAASRLIAQYTDQQAQEMAVQGACRLEQLAAQGAITAVVSKTLSDLRARNVPVDEYLAKLNELVAQGKLTPAAAKELADSYKTARAQLGAADALNALIRQQAAVAASCVTAQVASGKISQAVADELLALQQKQAPMTEYQGSLQTMEKGGRVSKSDISALIACYQKLASLQEQAKRLQALQGNNASAATYAEELKRAVESGLLTPQQANDLMQEYQAMVTPVTALPVAGGTSLPGTADFARLQQRVQEQARNVSAGSSGNNQDTQFAAAASQAEAARQQLQQQKIQQIQSTMMTQAQALLASWQQVPKMVHVQGQSESGKAGEKGASASSGSSSTVTTTTTTTTEGPVVIKTGTILFGVLETAVNSDYPDTPVFVKIVQGPMRGAKLIGKLSLAQGKDKMSLNFTVMDMDAWPKTKSVNAFAIDPDTARTVMASSVDYHYLKRYGGLFAASFLTGYSSAITNAGTSTTGIFGTSTTHPNLSPGNRIAVALGQVGTAFSSTFQNYINTPTTVEINAGVGVGILFVSDVS